MPSNQQKRCTDNFIFRKKALINFVLGSPIEFLLYFYLQNTFIVTFILIKTRVIDENRVTIFYQNDRLYAIRHICRRILSIIKYLRIHKGKIGQIRVWISWFKIYWIVTTRLKFGWFYIKESSICSHNKVNVGTCISCFIILKGSIVNLKFHAKNIDSSSFISRQISFEYWIPYTKYLIRIWILEKDCTTNFACSPSKTTIINL